MAFSTTLATLVPSLIGQVSEQEKNVGEKVDKEEQVSEKEKNVGEKVDN